VAWKKLSGHVHRNPKYPIILAFFCGTGTQVGLMGYVYLFTMALGLIHPYMKWTWVGSALLISVGAGYCNGYVTANCMRSAGLSDWVGGATAAAFCYPMVTMCCFIIIDLIEWAEFNVYDWPVTTVILYSAIWMVTNICACYFGAVEGYRGEQLISSRKSSSVPRKIPNQP
jgi:hypothetical protein